jgi:hypothetical protein
MRRLLALLRGRKAPRKAPPIDSERLLRIYRETHVHVEELRRAA